MHRPEGLELWRRRFRCPSRVPVLENMGFKVVDERTYEIRRRTCRATHVWLHDMTLERADGAPIDLDALQSALESCFLVVMRGVAENDGYNALVLAAGLRGATSRWSAPFSRFLRQIRAAVSRRITCGRRCAQHPAIAPKIVELFHARFDPRRGSRGRARRRRG